MAKIILIGEEELTIDGDKILAADQTTGLHEKSVSTEHRTALFTISTDGVDCDGDIIKQSGIEVADFQKKNPVGLWSHNPWAFPIFANEKIHRNIKGDDFRYTTSRFRFPKEGGHEASDTAFFLVSENILRACSIGFKSLDRSRRMEKVGDPYNPGAQVDRQVGWIFNKIRLMEVSLCSDDQIGR